MILNKRCINKPSKLFDVWFKINDNNDDNDNANASANYNDNDYDDDNDDIIDGK